MPNPRPDHTMRWCWRELVENRYELREIFTEGEFNHGCIVLSDRSVPANQDPRDFELTITDSGLLQVRNRVAANLRIYPQSANTVIIELP